MRGDVWILMMGLLFRHNRVLVGTLVTFLMTGVFVCSGSLSVAAEHESATVAVDAEDQSSVKVLDPVVVVGDAPRQRR